MKDAPAFRASKIWYSLEIKSFLRVGIETALETLTKSSSLPRKPDSSVKTETASAPDCSYPIAISAGSAISAKNPFDGLARLISAISLTRSIGANAAYMFLGALRLETVSTKDE